jgi:hypothetical protein
LRRLWWPSWQALRHGCRPQANARRFNWPAAITLLLSVSAIPLLLAISWSQSPTTYAPHSVDRLGIMAPGSLSSPGALFVFVTSNIAHWLGSSVVRQCLWVMIVDSFGSILLRPYYLIVGLPTTVVAWLMNRNDLLRTPRFFQPRPCIGVSRWQVLRRLRAVHSTAANGRKQQCLRPRSQSQHCRRPLSSRSYRTRGGHTSHDLPPFLARGAQRSSCGLRALPPSRQARRTCCCIKVAVPLPHDRNVFWLTRLRDRSAPIWILGDSEDNFAPFRVGADHINPNSGIRIRDYTVIDRRGRFVLLKKRE